MSGLLEHWREDWELFRQEEQVILYTVYFAVAALVWQYAPTAIYICLGGVATLLLRRWMIGARCRSDVSLQGKTALVTGGNCGIGREVALELSRRGARVIIASRDLSKSRLAAAEIRSQTGGQVLVKQLDLASFKSVRELAADIVATEPHLHILVNNAGLMMVKRTTTADGHEMTLQVNYLGPWLLTHLLSKKLAQSPPARVVNVSSLAHRWTDLNLDDLEGRRVPYDPWRRYGTSKLLQILHSRELSRRLRQNSVTAFSAHPGVVDTEFDRDQRQLWYYSRHMKSLLFSFLFRNSRMGAQTPVYCAVEPSLATHPGTYFADCARGWASREATDDQLAKRVWELTAKMLDVDEK